MMNLKKKPSFGIWLIGAGISVLLIAGLLAIEGLRTPAVVSTPTAPVAEDIPYPQVVRISVKDARAAFEMQAAVFVDVRGDPWYATGHIPGALNLTEKDLLAGLADYPRSTWIITYCT